MLKTLDKRLISRFPVGELEAGPPLEVCGSRGKMEEQNASTVNRAGLSDNAASGLAYVTIIPAIIFLVLEPYNRNATVRFHSWQCIFLALAWIVVSIGLMILGMVPGVVFLEIVLWPLVDIAFFILWLYLLISAFNGKRVKLPIVGELAERQAGA